MFMDRLIYDVEWLARAVDVDIEDAPSLQERTWESLRFEMLLMARWVLVMSYFERELYANPQREDLDAFWWDLVEELQMVPRPEGRVGPDWAAKIHLTVAPVYYHNYLLGELTASQLGSSLRRDVLNGKPAHGYVGLAELGSFFGERIFRRGAAVDWQTLLQEATGSRLSAAPFLEEFVTLPEGVQPPQG
jgi:peptidyl-dipeptidase A